MLAQFREWGWDARIETYDVLFPTPKERLLELVAPTQFKATLEEPAVAVDPTSGQKAEQLPTYNAYSIDGDVTAPLVYVNYGRPEDYEELDAARRLGEGRDRHRALRRIVARHQAEDRGRARRRRLPDLLRSARRRLLRATRCFPTVRCATRTACSAAASMDLPMYPGDPLTPGIGAPCRARSGCDRQGRADADEDPGAADLLWRRAAAAGGDAAAAWRRRPGAARCRSRIDSGPGRRRCI